MPQMKEWAARQVNLDPVPEHVSAERLRKIRTLVRWLDDAWTVPLTGYRIGLDGLIGLVPGAGDLVTALMSAYIIREAARMGIPRHLIARMTANLLADFFAGAIPILGDVVDVAFKSNKRNLALLDEHLKKHARHILEAEVRRL